MKTIINENQRGLLFKDGKYEKMLEPGKHSFLSRNITVEIMNITAEFKLADFDLSVFLNDKVLKEQLRAYHTDN